MYLKKDIPEVAFLKVWALIPGAYRAERVCTHQTLRFSGKQEQVDQVITVPCTIQEKAAEEKKRQTDIVGRCIQKTAWLRSEALQAMSGGDYADR
jgi:hypothetical protein